MIQDVVPLLSGCDLDELAQEKRCSLGDGSQLGDVFGLSLQAVDLNREDASIRTCMRLPPPAGAGSTPTIILSTMVSLLRM